MSDLPRDLLEEIFFRVPFTSLKAVRSTCQEWNAVSKDRSFTNKHIDKAPREEREFLMIMDFKVYLISINLHKTHKNVFDLSINRKGKLISLDNSDKVFYMSQVFHCNGLCLCVSQNKGTRLVVWNPYFGETRWLDPICKYPGYDTFALGYDPSCGSHKILRFFQNTAILEIYDLSTDSWRSLSGPPDWWCNAVFKQHGVSLNGNTYWLLSDKQTGRYFCNCFDFSREKFGLQLFLPWTLRNGSLSVIGEEKLALLLELKDTSRIQIWVTNKIESDTIWWTRFLEVDMMKPFPIFFAIGNFLIDEEKKVAVVFDKEEAQLLKPSSNTAYIIGEKGYFKSVDLKQSANTQLCPLVCSYVPSSLQIN